MWLITNESWLDHKNVHLLRGSELAAGETKATIHSGTKSALQTESEGHLMKYTVQMKRPACSVVITIAGARGISQKEMIYQSCCCLCHHGYP